MPYDGGYYLLPEQFIRTGLNKHTSDLTQPFGPETIRAINEVQNTAWRINSAVLEVMRDMWSSGAVVADVPTIGPEATSRIPDDAWEAMSKEEQAAHKKQLSETHGRNARAEGLRYSWLAKLDMATQLAEEPALWFPYFCDFRGRLYPTVADLSPQGDDAGKALLMFARGKPLGDTGLFWLCIRAANCYAQDGVDKLSLEDRVKWVQDNWTRIVEAALAPIDGTRWWAEAEEPWSFLAML
jgi:DNA-directed RNA polymerase